MHGESDQPDSVDELSGDLQAVIECLKRPRSPKRR